MAARLFAYGTIRRGQAPPEIAAAVGRLRPMGTGSLRGTLHDLGEYPGAVFRRRTEARIEGEVYEVPNESVLHELDAYEAFDPLDHAASLFLRRRKKVRMHGTGDEVMCWVYEYNRPVEE